MECLLKSEHFFDATNKGCFVRTPVDIVVGTLRSFGLTVDEGSTHYDLFELQYVQNAILADMQMVPGDPPNVAGWQAFRQFPQYYRMWINSDTIRNRNQYTDIISVTDFFQSSFSGDIIRIDPVAFASQFDDPQDPNKLIDDVVRLLLPQPISDIKKGLLKSILLSGLPTDNYWTAAWFDYIDNPDDPMAVEVVTVRLSILCNYVLKLPEYQLA